MWCENQPIDLKIRWLHLIFGKAFSTDLPEVCFCVHSKAPFLSREISGQKLPLSTSFSLSLSQLMTFFHWIFAHQVNCGKSLSNHNLEERICSFPSDLTLYPQTCENSSFCIRGEEFCLVTAFGGEGGWKTEWGPPLGEHLPKRGKIPSYPEIYFKTNLRNKIHSVQ